MFDSGGNTQSFDFARKPGNLVLVEFGTKEACEVEICYERRIV